MEKFIPPFGTGFANAASPVKQSAADSVRLFLDRLQTLKGGVSRDGDGVFDIKVDRFDNGAMSVRAGLRAPDTGLWVNEGPDTGAVDPGKVFNVQIHKNGTANLTIYNGQNDDTKQCVENHFAYDVKDLTGVISDWRQRYITPLVSLSGSAPGLQN